jgi:tryptophan 2,3-dioxygenase
MGPDVPHLVTGGPPARRDTFAVEVTVTRDAPTYWDYLRVPELLSLQGGLEDDESALMPDELHFIIVHQAYELWFKLVLRELRLARDHLSAPKVPEEAISLVVHHLRRVGTVMHLLVDQFAVMETLTPQDFLAFRDKLTPASGFQSYQMRELEMLLGLSDEERVAYGDTHALQHIEALAKKSSSGEAIWKRVQATRSEGTLRSALHSWLYRTPIQGSAPTDPGDAAVVHAFLEQYLARVKEHQRAQAKRTEKAMGLDPVLVERRFAEESKNVERFLFAHDVPDADRERTLRIRASLLFIESYRDLPLLAWPRLLLDSIVEVEEQFVLWRNRHARMVERVIGRRVGTGGSSGVDYLDQTARMRVFPELWSVRTLLLPRTEVPDLLHPEVYGFAR